MISEETISVLLADIENERVERTVSTKDTDKFAKAVCAFKNDLSNKKLPGYLMVGAFDDGSLNENDTETIQKQHRNDTENLSGNEQKILENIAANPVITSHELSEIVGISAVNIRVNISKLKAKGLLEREGGSKGGYWKVNSLFLNS